MENPYQSPPDFVGQATPFRVGGKARQILVVAILLMVQGGLEVLMGGMLALLGSAFAVVSAQGPQPATNAPPQAVAWLMVGTYAVMGVGAFFAAAIKLFAGWRNYSFRNRGWGVAALLSCVISLATCYCFPTAVVLMIYGLVIYLSADSAWAFSMGDQGLTREQVLWHLQRDVSV